jgi:imidazolonepropionase-like amidohydrolase
MLTALLLLALNADPSPKTFVLKAARLFDGRANALVSPGLVVVQGGRIVGLGAAAKIPDGAEVINLGDVTLSPGFIDAHTHMSGEASNDWKQDFVNGFQRSTAEQAIEATGHAQKTLMTGFTTVRDVGSQDLIDVGLRNAIARGLVPGPRMLVSVSGIGTTGGHCDDTAGVKPGLITYSPVSGVADGPDAMRFRVRNNIKYGADVIKVCATGGVLSLTDDVDTAQLTQAELDALIDEAHSLRRKVAAHAHGALGAKRAIRAGVDSIEHGTFLDDEALDMMKAKGTFLVPTQTAIQGLRERLEKNALPPPVVPKAKAAMAQSASMLKRAVAKGVKIVVGTDAAVYPHGRNAEEFSFLVAAGMKPLDALKAGTSLDAELLGLKDLGTLEVGKIADLVAMPGDPSKDIRMTEKVMFVMKEGVVFRNDAAAK